MSNLLVRSVRVLGTGLVDLHIEAGRIVRVCPAGNAPEIRAEGYIREADGLVALPCFVDLHTHLREPGGEHAETIASGTRAAAAGGYSDVFAMANTSPVCDSAAHVGRVLTQARQSASIRVHPVGAITVGLRGERVAPLAAMALAGARLFSDDGRCVENARLLREAMRVAADHGLVIAQHAQDGSLAVGGQLNDSAACRHTGLTPWPAVAEEIIIARDVVLAGETGAALHICHVSTAGAVEIVRWAKSRGWPVTAEVTPHHLLLTDELAALTDPRFKVNPPLRAAADVAALRAALFDGTIDIVATDHAPHTSSAKATTWIEAPFGMTGLETALAVVARVFAEGHPEGRVDWHQLAAAMSYTPARIGGIDSIAGRPLAVGEPATFCLVDSAADWTVNPDQCHSRSSNTPFAGTTFRHRVVATFIDGRPVHTDGSLIPESTMHSR